MAAPYGISIDTVYQRVLALANKEQRGYITPQEFNILANQAQLDIFEQYFYELNLWESKEQNLETGFSNMRDLINNKISVFKSLATMVHTTGAAGGYWTWPAGGQHYRTGRITYKYKEPRIITSTEAYNIQQSTFHKAALQNHEALEEFDRGYKLWNHGGEVLSGTDLRIEVIDKPEPVEWCYTIVNEQALYNAGLTVDFELHEADETDLIIKILELAGIVIQKPDLVSTAAQEESQNANEEMK